MAANLTRDQFRASFLNNTPMMDMRAPLEFTKGAFPGATSLPLMTDQERAKVGTCYKKHGQEAAIKLGHQLVRGEIREQRMAQWLDFAKQHPDGYLYCFRGGLRSRTVQQWLRDAGVDYPLVEGGYKALRSFLLEEMERLVAKFDFVLVAGPTGSGKTELLMDVDNIIDLEGLANHRGSSFGRNTSPQPSQIDFDNRLAIALMRAEHAGHQRIVLEDECHLIGRNALPLSLHAKMKQSPVLLLDESTSDRQRRIRREYVDEQLASFIERDGIDAGFAAFEEYLTGSLKRINKRLGDLRYRQLLELMQQALKEQQQSGNSARHLEWIAPLMEYYYDPMYSYQLQQKLPRVIFQGDRRSLVDFIHQGQWPTTFKTQQ